MRFVIISDTHSRHGTMKFPVPDGDVLIHAGDFTNTGLTFEVEKFLEWFSEFPHPHKIIIAGNHDMTLELDYYNDRGVSKFHTTKQNAELTKEMVVNHPTITYLEDAEHILPNGLKIWGSPWQPEFCDWAFNLNRGPDCLEKWVLIPDDSDIVITHGPPFGYGDVVKPANMKVGCEDMERELVGRVRPMAHIFGHIHEGYGVFEEENPPENSTPITFINASTCQFSYKPANPPIVFELEKEGDDGVVIIPTEDWMADCEKTASEEKRMIQQMEELKTGEEKK